MNVVLGIVEVFVVIVIGLFVVIFVVVVYNCYVYDIDCFVICFEIFIEEFLNIL